MSPNDPTRVREEKARLYQSAVDAWGRGEVTAALQKLEELAALDRQFPDPDTGRGSTYRNFYNQVNSESEALKNAYEAARAKVSSGDLKAALAVCQQYLEKYPNHAPFQSLKAEIESRQHIPQAIADTDRKAEAEPDLERRVAILEEARKLYPGEAHFEAAMQSACEMRDLVRSIVTQARFFEQNGQPKDALDQWQILKSIHPKQPGLAAEIERLTAQDARPAAAAAPKPASFPPPPTPAAQQATSQWVGQVQKYLDAGDYQRANQALVIGLAENPTDSVLLALDAEVRKGQERASRALELLGKAHDEMNQGATETARNSLREAYKLDPRNTVIRTVLVNSLLEEARRALDSNLQTAEALVREILRLEPGNPQAVILVQGIAGRQAAPPQPVTPPIVPPPPPPSPAILPPPAQAVATPPRAVAPVPASLRDAETVAVPASVAEGVLKKSPAKETPPPAPPASVAPKPAATLPPKPGQPKKLLLGTGAAVVLLVLVALGVTLSRHRQESAKTPSASSKYAVVLRSTPEGAEIKIDGNSCGKSTCSIDLPPGNHQLSAELSGYQTTTLPIVIGPGAAKEFNVTLAPQGPRVAVFTDMPDGAVSLDDAPAGQIQGGGAEIGNLAAGKHVLAVKGGDSTASIPIEISPGAAPTVTGSIDAKNARCFVVAGFGGDAHVYGSATGFRATLDGKPLGVLAAAGLPLQGLTPGSHELVIDSDAGTHDRMVFESQPSASLYVSMGTSQTLGTLSVSVEPNEDQIHLLINGQRYKRDTTRGHLVVYLYPRKYTVTVQKDGFAPAAEQTVEVKKGVDTKVAFTLSAAKAVLAVHHAPPGTDVLVDNISRGATHPDGEFQVGGIEPGHHTVTLRHDGFRPMQSDQTFAAGKTLDLTAALEALPTTGTLRFEISPAGVDAHIRIKRDGDTLDRDVAGASVTVPEGRYLVSVSAPQYAAASTSVQVTAGGTAVAALTLRHVETAKAPPKAPAGPTFGLEDWLKVPGWSSQNGLLVHKGGDWVMATPDIAQGTIRFTVVSIKGRHVEWGVACRDEKNFVHYELDDKNLTRYEVRNGSKLTQIKKPHGLDKKEPMGFRLTVTPQSVVVSVQHSAWVDLDKWDSIVAPVHGRFGFRIPGSDEIGLQDFTITPN